jgi:hypothetical protein
LIFRKSFEGFGKKLTWLSALKTSLSKTVVLAIAKCIVEPIAAFATLKQ